MVRIIALLTMALLVLTLTGCGDPTVPHKQPEPPASKDTKVSQGKGLEKETEKWLPEISSEAIELAINELLANKDVVDAAVNVKREEKTIVLAVQVNYLVNEEKAKELGESFARLLATFAADSEKTRMPGMDLSNTIYDYYDLNVIVGTGPEPHERLAYGVKSSIGYNIAW